MSFLKGVSDQITVKVDAEISDPEDSARAFKVSVKATFKRRQYDDAQNAVNDVRNPDSEVNEADLIREDLVDWDIPGDGGPVEFSPENVEVAIGHAEYREALFRAWGQAQLGRVLAKAKN